MFIIIREKTILAEPVGINGGGHAGSLQTFYQADNLTLANHAHALGTGDLFRENHFECNGRQLVWPVFGIKENAFRTHVLGNSLNIQTGVTCDNDGEFDRKPLSASSVLWVHTGAAYVRDAQAMIRIELKSSTQSR